MLITELTICIQVTNLRTLSAFLSSVRRAYLDLSSSSSNTNQSTPRQRQPPSQQAGNSILSAWDGVKHLTNRDRDEIDYSVKLALRKSVDRVRELEQLEKGQSPLIPLHSATALLLLP